MYPPYAFEAYVDEFCRPGDDAHNHVPVSDVLWASPHAQRILPGGINSTWYPNSTPILDAPARRAPISHYPPLMAAIIDDLNAPSSPSCSSSSSRSPLSFNSEYRPMASASGLTFSGSDATGPNHAVQASCVSMAKSPPTVARLQVGSVKMKLASAKRREAPAKFVCPLFECGSTFTKKHNMESKSALLRYLRAELYKD